MKLRDMGLIRGAVRRARSSSAGWPAEWPLRFPDEYVRHKILDLIGDLALAGRRIEAMSWPSAPVTPCTRRWYRDC